MPKKSIGLGIIFVILSMAFLPAIASAALYSGTTLLPTGTKIVGNTIGQPYFEDQNGNVTVTCSGSRFDGELVQNEATGKVKVNITSFTYSGTGAEGKCPTAVGDAQIKLDTPMCMASFGGTSEWQARQGLCSQAAASLGMTWQYGASIEHYTKYAGNLWWSVAQSAPLQISLNPGQIYKWDSGISWFPTLAPRGTWELKTAAGATIRVT
jgi:hypothetical protein